MKTPACPRCQSEFIRRSSRRNTIEHLASAFRIYPFRCQICQHRFLSLRRHERYVTVLEPERREYERMTVQAWNAVWPGERGGSARVIDVSTVGAAIETDVPLREGEILELRMTPAGADRPIAVERAMVRTTQPGRVGVQFIRVQEDDEGRLRQYLYEVFVSRLR